MAVIPTDLNWFRYEHTNDGHFKFWEVAVRGKTMYRRWGKIGTAGQSHREDFLTHRNACDRASELCWEKKSKGYVQVHAGVFEDAITDERDFMKRLQRKVRDTYGQGGGK